MAGKKGMHDRHTFNEEYMNRLRARIRSTKLVERLQNHIDGSVELSQSQVTAALGLLRKVLPELASTEVKAQVTHWTDAITRVSQADQQVTPTPAVDEDRPAVH
jgi:predicted XRE-type DNA-binding protein